MSRFGKAKSWVEVKVGVPASWVEGVSNFLIELGSGGVIQKDDSTVLAYFPDLSSFPGRRKRISRYLSDLSASGEKFIFQWRRIPEEKWGESWKAHFKPLHATPQMCLRALEKLIPVFARPPSVLDFGTGSGILAIAAGKLGAGKILALDVDPAAIRWARRNAALNRWKEGIDFRMSPARALRRRFGIVVANLLPQELWQASSFLARRVSPRGFLVVSGILRGQKEETASAFMAGGLTVESSEEKKGWACLTLKKHRA